MNYDSDSETDMASGSRKARSRGLKGDRVPRWDAQKTTYDSWWYDMVPYLKTQGLWDTAQGVDRHWKDDETKGAEYEKLAQRLWRTLTRAIMDDTLAGANMKMVMRDDFPADGDQGDGYELNRWMNAYANDLTEREVTKIVDQVEKGFKFNVNESPDVWNYTGQRMKSTWEKIPPRRRGGGTEYLTHKLLEKVGKAEKGYVAYLKAVTRDKPDAMADYQGMLKEIVDHHRENYDGDDDGDRRIDLDTERRDVAKPKVLPRKSTSTSAAAFAGWAASPTAKKAAGQIGPCNRCGEMGHLKANCKKVCSLCGLQSCGGVKSVERCMTKNGIPPRLVAAMKKDAKGREITSMIRKRASEKGWSDPVAAVVVADDDDAEADIVEGAIGPDAIDEVIGDLLGETEINLAYVDPTAHSECVPCGAPNSAGSSMDLQGDELKHALGLAVSEVGEVGKDPTVAAGVVSVLMSLDDSTLNVLLREEETLEIMVIDALQSVSSRRGLPGYASDSSGDLEELIADLDPGSRMLADVEQVDLFNKVVRRQRKSGGAESPVEGGMCGPHACVDTHLEGEEPSEVPAQYESMMNSRGKGRASPEMIGEWVLRGGYEYQRHVARVERESRLALAEILTDPQRVGESEADAAREGQLRLAQHERERDELAKRMHECVVEAGRPPPTKLPTTASNDEDYWGSKKAAEQAAESYVRATHLHRLSSERMDDAEAWACEKPNDSVAIMNLKGAISTVAILKRNRDEIGMRARDTQEVWALEQALRASSETFKLAEVPILQPDPPVSSAKKPAKATRVSTANPFDMLPDEDPEPELTDSQKQIWDEEDARAVEMSEATYAAEVAWAAERELELDEVEVATILSRQSSDDDDRRRSELNAVEAERLERICEQEAKIADEKRAREQFEQVMQMRAVQAERERREKQEQEEAWRKANAELQAIQADREAARLEAERARCVAEEAARRTLEQLQTATPAKATDVADTPTWMLSLEDMTDDLLSRPKEPLIERHLMAEVERCERGIGGKGLIERMLDEAPKGDAHIDQVLDEAARESEAMQRTELMVTVIGPPSRKQKKTVSTVPELRASATGKERHQMTVDELRASIPTLEERIEAADAMPPLNLPPPAIKAGAGLFKTPPVSGGVQGEAVKTVQRALKRYKCASSAAAGSLEPRKLQWVSSPWQAAPGGAPRDMASIESSMGKSKIDRTVDEPGHPNEAARGSGHGPVSPATHQSSSSLERALVRYGRQPRSHSADASTARQRTTRRWFPPPPQPPADAAPPRHTNEQAGRLSGDSLGGPRSRSCEPSPRHTPSDQLVTPPARPKQGGVRSQSSTPASRTPATPARTRQGMGTIGGTGSPSQTTRRGSSRPSTPAPMGYLQQAPVVHAPRPISRNNASGAWWPRRRGGGTLSKLASGVALLVLGMACGLGLGGIARTTSAMTPDVGVAAHRLASWARPPFPPVAKPLFAHERREAERIRQLHLADDDAQQAICLTAGDGRTLPNGTAILDGGCTHSCWCDLNAFDPHTLHEPAITGVKVGDGRRLKVAYEGTVDVLMKGKRGERVRYRRPNVLYVPDLKRNLISERQEWSRYQTRIQKEDVQQMSLKVTSFDGPNGAARVQKKTVPIQDVGDLYGVKYEAQRVSEAEREDGEAGVAEPYVQGEVARAKVTPAERALYELWHARLGDAHPRKMQLMSEHSTGTPLKRMNLTRVAQAIGTCSHCARARMRRSSIHETERKPERLMERTQIDVWGPTRVGSVPGGHRYLVLVLDEATGWLHVYPRRTHKASDIIDVLTLYEGDMQSSLEVVRSDGAAEFSSDELQFWLAERKVRWERSTPYVHEEIGAVERRNGIIIPVVRTMLLRAGMSAGHFASAAEYATWLYNRQPAHVRGKDVASPYEQRFGRQPDLSNARVYGAKAWALRDESMRGSKLQEVAVEGRWVGFDPVGAGHRVYAEGRYHLARHIKVDESNVMAKSTSTSDDSAVAGPAGAADVDQLLEQQTQPPAVSPPPAAAPAHEPEAGHEDRLDEDPPYDGTWLGIGEWVEVWFEDEKTWYAGRVTRRRRAPSGRVHHRIWYEDDGEHMWHDVDDRRTVPAWRRISRTAEARGSGSAEHENSQPAGAETGGMSDVGPEGASSIETGGQSAHHTTAQLIILDDEGEVHTLGVCEPAEGGGKDSLSAGSHDAIAYVSCHDNTKHVVTPHGTLAITVPKTHLEAMATPYANKWSAAEEKEIETCEGAGTWHRVPRPSATRIYKCHFVYDLKTNKEGGIEKFKARLVFQGAAQAPGSYQEVFAVTVRFASVRILLAVAALHDWELFNVDIKAAYLAADLDTVLHMCEPPGHETVDEQGRTGGTVCRLSKALYGTKQAGRCWRKHLDGWLKSYGFVSATFDECVYTMETDRGRMILGVFVDDIIAASSSIDLRQKFIADLSAQFNVDDRGDLEWALGMRIDRDRARRTLTVSTAARIQALGQKYGVDERTTRTWDTPASKQSEEGPSRSEGVAQLEAELLPPEEAERTRALIGALIYLGSTCRPDIAQATYRCATSMSKPTRSTWTSAVRVLTYLLRTRDIGITYGRGVDGANLHEGMQKSGSEAARDHAERREARKDLEKRAGLQSWSDASWEAFSPSITGHVQFVNGGPVAWSSKKQPSTSLSSAEAETYAAASGAAEVVWVRGLLADMGMPEVTPTPLWVDNQAAVAMASDASSIGRTRHIARRARFLLEVHTHGALRPAYCPGLQQVADLLTKPLERARFIMLRQRLMNTEHQVEARGSVEESRRGEKPGAFDQSSRDA